MSDVLSKVTNFDRTELGKYLSETGIFCDESTDGDLLYTIAQLTLSLRHFLMSESVSVRSPFSPLLIEVFDVYKYKYIFYFGVQSDTTVSSGAKK